MFLFRRVFLLCLSALPVVCAGMSMGRGSTVGLVPLVNCVFVCDVCPLVADTCFEFFTCADFCSSILVLSVPNLGCLYCDFLCARARLRGFRHRRCSEWHMLVGLCD